MIQWASPILGDYAKPREKNTVEFHLYGSELTPSAIQRERWNTLSMTSMGPGGTDIVVSVDIVGVDLTNAGATLANVEMGSCSALDQDVPFAMPSL